VLVLVLVVGGCGTKEVVVAPKTTVAVSPPIVVVDPPYEPPYDPPEVVPPEPVTADRTNRVPEAEDLKFPKPAVAKPEIPDTRKIVTDVRPPFKPTYSVEKKAKFVKDSRLNLQRVFVCTDEMAVLSTGNVAFSVVREALIDKLTKLNFKVIESSSTLGFSPSEAEQDAFRESENCNLVFLAAATTGKADKFGNFWSFSGKVRGKLLNLTTHEIIGSKNVDKRGKRALGEGEAATSSLRAAGEDAATWLTDKAVEKWEATSLERTTFVAANITNAEMADDIRVGLEKRVGVRYVSLEGWDSQSQTAFYDILYRYDVRKSMESYIYSVRGKGNVKINLVDKGGKVIKIERNNNG